jgi:hypothetical protein
MNTADLIKDGWKEVLAEFRADCEQALAKTVKYGRDNKISYSINTADLRVVSVSIAIDEDGDKTLQCLLEEGSDNTFDVHVTMNLSEDWSARGFYCEVRSRW